MLEKSFPLDYYIQVLISEDRLSALIQFSHCEDNFSVTASQLEQLLKAQNISHGIDYPLLDLISQNPKSYFFMKTTVATGTPPVDGKAGYINYTVNIENEAKKPLELEDGKVDFKEVISLNNVRKGQLLASRFPPTEGISGKSVSGEILKAKSGKEARFKIGKNVVVNPDQNHLYAAIDGLLTKTDREKINVFPIYEVNGDVDFHTGNIDFVGTVVVRGNVVTGFKVKASGDIRILGNVEAAELEAGGSIEISSGILGHHKGLIKAGVNVKCAYIQDGIVEAAEDVIVTQSIMHSTVRAGSSVICNGPKGLIVGGTTQAGVRVLSRTIGNSMSTTTVIEVGVLPELRNELISLRTSLKTQTDGLQKTEKALVLLDQLAASGQLSSEKFAMRIKLQHSKRQAAEDLTNLKERILEIEKSLADSDNAKVDVISNIYGGAKIVIGRHTKFVKDAVSRVTFRLYEGDISLFPL